MTEQEIHNIIKKSIDGLQDLKRHSDRLSSYDAYNDKVIVEYKCRRKYFHTSTQIEKQKFDKNTSKDLPFLYIVFDSRDTIHVWNVSKLKEQDYNFKWQTKRCPQTTDFDQKQYVDKVVGELEWSSAHRTIKLESN